MRSEQGQIAQLLNHNKSTANGIVPLIAVCPESSFLNNTVIRSPSSSNPLYRVVFWDHSHGCLEEKT